MSAVATFMLSLLGRQHQLLGRQFFERYSSDWLVWEPGPSRPSRILTSNSDTTLNPSGPEVHLPEGEDALCFELKRSRGASLAVGRATENDVVLNDLTISREQLVLHHGDQGWQVRGHGAGVCIDGAAAGEAAVLLRSGAVITAGNARLTFYSAEGFPLRLEQENLKRRR